MALVELFISKEKYLARIDQLDVQLNRLNRIKDDYNSLLGQLQNEVVTGEDQNFEKMYKTAQEELRILNVQIQNAQTCRGLLKKTVEQMDENQTLVDSTLENTVNTLENTVSIAEDAANIAGTAAGVAAIL